MLIFFIVIVQCIHPITELIIEIWSAKLRSFRSKKIFRWRLSKIYNIILSQKLFFLIILGECFYNLQTYFWFRFWWDSIYKQLYRKKNTLGNVDIVKSKTKKRNWYFRCGQTKGQTHFVTILHAGGSRIVYLILWLLVGRFTITVLVVNSTWYYQFIALFLTSYHILKTFTKTFNWKLITPCWLT